MVRENLIVAQANPDPPWWIFPLFALVGLIMIGVGLYGIVKKRAILGRARRILRLFGIEEVTGTGAVVIGTGQCLSGTLILLVAITGPFWAGILAEPNSPADVAARPTAPSRPPTPATEPDSTPPVDSATPHAERAPLATSPPVETPPAERPKPVRLVAGSEHGMAFRDEVVDGGLLVGLRCAKGMNWGGALQAIQPVYQLGTGYKLGARCGTAGGDEEEVIAKPGYAIGAIHVRAGLVVNAVQLIFYRIAGDRLDPDDQYKSAWVGCEGGGPVLLDPHGDPITGVFGHWQEDLVSLGVLPTARLTRSVPHPTEPPPDLFATPRAGKRVGHPEGNEFRDTAPDGGILVGLRAFCDVGDAKTLRGLQPVYLVDQHYVEGQRHGDEGEVAMLAIARPGYAVAGVQYNRFGGAAGLRVVFAKLSAMGLDLQDKYLSDWLGASEARVEEILAVDSKFVAGLTGFDERVVTAVGLMQISASAVEVSAEPVPLTEELVQATRIRPPLRTQPPSGETFKDEAPVGGLLVGLRCSQGPNWGGALQALQPIYQVGSEYILGPRRGLPGGKETQLLAKPGYAIGAIHARIGLVVNAVQVVFYRIDGDRLHPGDPYTTDWVGSDGGSPYDLDAQGDPITSVFGSYDQDLTSLGVQPVQRLPEPMPLASGHAPRGGDGVKSAAEFRTWQSADGQATVEALLVAIEEDGVQLRRRDGKVVAVPLSRLSAQDVEYVRSLPTK